MTPQQAKAVVAALLRNAGRSDLIVIAGPNGCGVAKVTEQPGRKPIKRTVWECGRAAQRSVGQLRLMLEQGAI